MNESLLPPPSPACAGRNINNGAFTRAKIDWLLLRPDESLIVYRTFSCFTVDCFLFVAARCLLDASGFFFHAGNYSCCLRTRGWGKQCAFDGLKIRDVKNVQETIAGKIGNF